MAKHEKKLLELLFDQNVEWEFDVSWKTLKSWHYGNLLELIFINKRWYLIVKPLGNVKLSWWTSRKIRKAVERCNIQVK